MEISLEVHPAHGTTTQDPAPSAKDRKLLDCLVKLWRSHAGREFETRHKTGSLLNGRLGSPAKRQPHGQRVLKMVAEKLRIAESDLNRMRWFAQLFATVDALRQSHPEIDSWTRFKEGLTSLKAEYGYEARKPAANPSRPALGGVVRSLASLSAKLNGLDIQPGDAERQKLEESLRGLAEAFSRLKIRFVVAVE